MKTNQNIYYTLILLCFALFAHAQHSSSILTPGYWTFGINGGWAYQSSDVKAQLNGYGVGLTLGKNLYYHPNAPLAFDLRGRLLFTQQYGLDALRSYNITNNNTVNGSGGLNYLTYPDELQEARGFIFANHQTTTGELALEGLITLHRLRERTGVHVGLFGGIGLDWFRAKTDQADAIGKEYFEGYASLKDNQPTSAIRNKLKTILDGDYETIADGNNQSGSVKLMPSLGVELGYQLTPRFLVYGGHRVTFSGTDMLDGQRFENSNNDLYHYTNFGLRWTIDPQKNESLVKKPAIDLIAPFGSPYTTNSAAVSVIANIRNVNSAADVECLVNGRSVPFDYKNGRFAVNINLNIGNNDIIIIAGSEAGQARRNVIIVYKNEIISQPIVKAPVIRMINPSNDYFRTEEASFTVRAIIDNVRSVSEIIFTVNNVDRSFEWNNGDFRSVIALREGENQIEVRARNSAGVAAKEIIIFYQKPIQRKYPPIITFTEPSRNVSTPQSLVTLEAIIENVISKNDITLLVNGFRQYNFNFNTTTGKLTQNLFLERGDNEVLIIAVNRDGEDRASVIIRSMEEIVLKRPPVVRISEPLNNSETSIASTEIRARVDYILNKNNINLLVNGYPIYDFNYNISSQQLTARVHLEEGNNTIWIRATNADGSDEQTVNVRYYKISLPTVQIINPENNSETTEANVSIRAKVENVIDKRQIRLTLNGNVIPNFSFDRNRQEVTATATLIEGNNTIRLEASNDGGKAEDEINIRYRRAQPPTVRILEPANNLVTSSETITLRTRIETWNRRYTIKVLVNGKEVTNYDFKGNELAAPISLREGSNTIVVQAANTDGKAEASVAVRYERTKKPPTVTFTSPQNGATLKSNKTTVHAVITNVSSARGVIFKLNNKVVQEFELNGENFTAIVNLDAGNNILTLQAQNADGNAVAETQVSAVELVVSKPAFIAPSVIFTQPSEAGTVISEKSFNIVANIRNIKAAEAITLWVNGEKQLNFVLNTQQVSAQIDLKEGKNLIRIEAQTASGKVEAETNLIYQPAKERLKNRRL